MEARGVLLMYERSIAEKRARYRPMITDGDAASACIVMKKLPYTIQFPVEKAECIGHYGKRMGTALRKIKQQYKGK